MIGVYVMGSERVNISDDVFQPSQWARNRIRRNIEDCKRSEESNVVFNGPLPYKEFPVQEVSIEPCPFCGHNQVVIENSRPVRITCMQCHAIGPPADAEYTAIRLWNMRSDG